MPIPQTSRPTRVALYARYSSDMQQQSSIDDQLRICRDRAAQEGWVIVGEFSDAAISGASLIRPGIQALQGAAQMGGIDVVLTEALDRLSRNQADIASLYQTLSFHDVKIVTLAEGEINEMHIGLKGTMNALFLKDLARKTHRGLSGRVAKGKSAGGNAFGYRVERHLDSDGELVRGDRSIDPAEAATVVRIFEAYAGGMSPNKIADTLNAEAIPGPQGGAWDKSTIHGNPKRGTGILNNELYIGRLVWNRQRYVKDPATGKRQARLNPPEEWQISEVPELRIIDQSLWDQVKARQSSRTIDRSTTQAWNRRKPKFLLTGLIKCGCCGGGFSTVSKDRFGCSNARNKGASYCTNKATLARRDIEGRILAALSEHLMDPELVKIFCEEYVAEMNRLTAGQGDARAKLDRDLAKTIADHDKLVDAIVAGVPADRVKSRMEELARRQKALEAQLAEAEICA